MAQKAKKHITIEYEDENSTTKSETVAPSKPVFKFHQGILFLI